MSVYHQHSNKYKFNCSKGTTFESDDCQVYPFDDGPKILYKTFDSRLKVTEYSPFSIEKNGWGIELDGLGLDGGQGGMIRGKIYFYLPQVRGFTIEFDELVIIFEGSVKTEFCDEDPPRRSVINSSEQIFFQDEDNDVSPYRYYFIKDGRRKCRRFRSCGRSLHCFQFKINLNNLELAPSFEGPFGRVEYFLVLYGTFTWRLRTFSVMAQKKICTNGYRYLNTDSVKDSTSSVLPKNFLEVTKPTLTNGRGILTARLKLKESAIANGNDVLEFVFKLENPNYEFIGKLSVLLAQKIGYFANGQSKFTKSVIAKCENLCGRRVKMIQWKNELIVPIGTVHSFEADESTPIGVAYSVQFFVEIRGQIWIKGKIPILIGVAKTKDGPSFYF